MTQLSIHWILSLNRLSQKWGQVQSMTTALEIHIADDVIAEAERCRCEAVSLVKNDARYSELIGQPSAWCVVTEKGIWSRTFHTALEKDHLIECLEKGHRVILTVGLVSRP